MNKGKCPFCHKEEATSQLAYAGPGMISSDVVVSCPICGEFRINRHIDLPHYQREAHPENHIVRGIIRERNEQGQMALLSHELLERPRDYTVVPESPMDKLERLLVHFGNMSDSFGKEITAPSPETGQAITFAKNREEYSFILKYMLNQAKFIVNGAKGIVITFEGWQRIQELKKTSPASTQSFVAMSFDPSLDEAYQQGINPALKTHGYDPVIRMKEVEHDDKICDRILLEIRRSRLLVADFTFQRAGIYYEAGFAQGLGIPVIRTCREDDKDNLHFDTRQYNHILWTTPEDLQTQLSDRIAALYALKTKSADTRER